MKTRDIKELQTKTVAEIRVSLKELEESLRNSRLELAQRKLTNTTSITTMRHDIARMKTVLTQKQSEEATVKLQSTKGGSK